MNCFTANVRQCDLKSCLTAILHGGQLLSVTGSDALGTQLSGIFFGRAYVVVYEAATEIGWEVCC